jgi:hypothetical protein
MEETIFGKQAFEIKWSVGSYQSWMKIAGCENVVVSATKL